MEKKKTPKRWTKPRHKLITNLAKLIIVPICLIRYGIKAEPFRQQGDRAYLILMNHQTAFDQFFIGMSVKGAVYYIATEDIFNLGFLSTLLRWAVAPIPIKKQTTDPSAVMTCIRIAREGGTIALAPEGNRTYSGRTGYMNPAIAKMAKKIKLPIALYRIEGGYGIQPRWSDGTRRGNMRGYVSRVIEPEEYAAMTDQQLYETICQGLYVDEAKEGGTYRCKARAQYLERAVYVCPYCGLSPFESHGHTVRCTTCGREIHYGEDKRLTGVGFDFPFPYVGQWYDYQEQFINRFDPTAHVKTPLFSDRASIQRVIVYKRKEKFKTDVPVLLYGDRIEVDPEGTEPLILPFTDITAAACLGRNKLNIYTEKDVFQFKGDKRFNALKYVNLYFRHRNIIRGEENGKFLGL